MQSETRQCQNCKKDFFIESEDFNFYEKIKVPAPTWCPDCRLMRRLVWRNERSLYKRNCDLCKKIMISMYQEDTSFPVFCRECWYGDNWDAIEYGEDYDFSISFFEQLKQLGSKVPRLGLWQRNVINSPYSNLCGECKNVYLSVSVVIGSENVFYSKSIDRSSNIFDSYNMKDSENCYENIECEKNYNCKYTILSRNCLDSAFLVDCVNCSNCFLCSNLRNKEYYIYNKKYSRDDYLKEIKKYNLGSRKQINKLQKDFKNLCDNAVYRYANIFRAVNSSGNNLFNVKNCLECFDTYNSENLKHCIRCLNNMRDSMDVTFSASSEMLYEYTTGSINDYNVKFSYSAMNQVQDADYIESCMSCKNLFGCISLKNKQYCILNKQYTKEEYEQLVPKIIKHMNDMPYIDKKGRIYKYGEFFPPELSPFCYNETIAQEYFPLTKEEAIEQGYKWKDKEERNYTIDIHHTDIPNNIKDVDESIINKVIECEHQGKCNEQCTEAFKITLDELNFYKKYIIPLHDKCSNCRYYERYYKVLPHKLWHRKCMKEGCENEFETSYAPERLEIVYCEKCYNQEVY